ncbi:MAG: hypothetical protein PHI18_00210 [bacterium]|nr:hypothetical protein [bacterium]
MLYVEQGISLHEMRVRGLIPVSHTTLERWRAEGNWEALRGLKETGPQALLADVEVILRKVISDIADDVRAAKRPAKGAVDDAQKLLSMVEKARGDSYFLGHAVKTMELLVEYLAVSRRDELKGQLGDVLQGFLVWLQAGKDKR